MAQSLSNKNRLLEKYVQVVREDGLNTNKNVNIGINGSTPTVWMAGNVTVGGTFNSVGAITGPRTVSVVDMTAATAAPTAAQSGGLFLFDRAAGVTVTLPAPVVGLAYTFVVTTTVTSNSYKVITDAGTTFLQGTVVASSDNLASKSFLGNGTTHIAITQQAASSNATGGILGSVLEFRCVTATLWQVWGQTVASATPASPWATS